MPNHSMLRDEHGDVSLIVSEKPCPRCSSPTVQLHEPKPSLPVEIITAVRDAGLTTDELLDLVDALRRCPRDSSPREVGERVPNATKLVSVASRAGAHWIELLMLLLMVVALYMDQRNASQSHRDAQEAIEQDDRRERRQREQREEAAKDTRELSGEDIERIADELAERFESKRSK